MVVLVGDKPKSLKDAVKYELWKSTMQREIKALEDNDTWTLDALPPGKCALGKQWVYRRKYNSNGTLECLKACLVVIDNH